MVIVMDILIDDSGSSNCSQ